MIQFSKNKFFSKEECDTIISVFMETGYNYAYSEEELNSWDCRKVNNKEFTNSIIDKIYNLYNENNIEFWFDYNTINVDNVNVTMTRYYSNRWLDLHLDRDSSYTTVISLTDGYSDGRFVLSETESKLSKPNPNAIKLDLKLGEGVTFEGNRIYHGVMPVTTGIRCALNLWMHTPVGNHKLI